MSAPPKIDNAPGLAWKPRVRGWEARWQARTDLVRKGYGPKSRALWSGSEPSAAEAEAIAQSCQSLQRDMLAWAAKQVAGAEVSKFDGTLRSLIACYETDPDSSFKKVRYQTRNQQIYMLIRINRYYGHLELKDIEARHFYRMHDEWTKGGKIATGHAMAAMMRGLMKYGRTLLDSPEGRAQCARLSANLSDLRFPMSKPRENFITAEQVTAHRAMAHKMGFPSIALAEAFQFECTLRQKDAIGEWVPLSEPGVSTTFDGNMKWLRGLRWEEITRTPTRLVLKHITSKKSKLIEVDLMLAPMVMEEFEKQFPNGLPTEGPIVVSEATRVPWITIRFGRKWREIANACGIPKGIWNMDSRAGAITEATDAGAQLEDVRHAATHGDISMTQRYSRGAVEKTAKVMQLRAEKRAQKTGDQ